MARRFVISLLIVVVVLLGFSGVAWAPCGIIVVRDDTFSVIGVGRVGDLDAVAVRLGVSGAHASSSFDEDRISGDDVTEFIALHAASGFVPVSGEGFSWHRWSPSGRLEVRPEPLDWAPVPDRCR